MSESEWTKLLLARGYAELAESERPTRAAPVVKVTEPAYTPEEPATRRDKAEAKAVATRLRDELTSASKRRYRRQR
jgi:hypothetical protein